MEFVKLGFPVLFGCYLGWLFLVIKRFNQDASIKYLALHTNFMLIPLLSLFLYVHTGSKNPELVQFFVNIYPWGVGVFYWLFVQNLLKKPVKYTNQLAIFVIGVGALFALLISLFNWHKIQLIYIVFLFPFGLSLFCHFKAIGLLISKRRDLKENAKNSADHSLKSLLLLSYVQLAILVFDSLLLCRIIFDQLPKFSEFITIYWLEAAIASTLCLFAISSNQWRNISGTSRNHALLLDEETAQQLVAKLTSQIEVQKLYQDPDLTLESLSKILALRRQIVSEVLNQYLGKSFYQFVTEFRLDDVAKQLSTNATLEYPIYQLALNAGFGNKSTFNREFKKAFNMTPSDYRKTHSGLNTGDQTISEESK